VVKVKSDNHILWFFGQKCKV